jgi:putative FmdB family regulatory protein
MPIYVFRCDDCGEQFDRLQKLSDPDPDTCPHCGRHHVHRQVTAPAFRLAGSGWYETDFKSDKEKKRNLVDGGKATAETPADKPKVEGKSEGSGKETAKPAAVEKSAGAAGE